MQKSKIIEQLKKYGCRITKQRLIILEIILEGDCSSCKEIYYKAIKKDPKIGTATVYRMINTLEEIGAISRSNMYRIDSQNASLFEGEDNDCIIEFEDSTTLSVPKASWYRIIESGLLACGYSGQKEIRNIIAQPT